MSEMIERVARAIDLCEMPDGDPFGVVVAMSDYVDGPHTVQDICKIIARAAIEAMKRPTEEMALAGRPTSLYPARTFASMIDAALTAPPE